MKVSKRQLFIWFWNVIESKNNEDNFNYFGMAFCSLQGVQWLTRLLQHFIFFSPGITQYESFVLAKVFVLEGRKGASLFLSLPTHSANQLSCALPTENRRENCRGRFFPPALNNLAQQTMKTTATSTILASMTQTLGSTSLVYWLQHTHDWTGQIPRCTFMDIWGTVTADMVGLWTGRSLSTFIFISLLILEDTATWAS